MIENLRLIELFAGYGSQALALKYLGIHFEHWYVCEFNQIAINAYNAIHDTNFEKSDIRNIHGIDLNVTDTDCNKYLLTYSFPCQDLSTAGKQKGMAPDSNTRSSLLWEVERLLNECLEKPQYLFMENVPQIINKDNSYFFKKWILSLSRFGYKNYYAILNAKDYGVPQNRERCFMVSILKSEKKSFCFPKKNKDFLVLSDILEDEVDDIYLLNTNNFAHYIGIKNKKPFRLGRFNEIEICGKLDQSTVCFKSHVNIIYDNGICSTLLHNSGRCSTTPQHMIKICRTSTGELRCLTPKEHFRLMGVNDSDYGKLESFTENQKYNLAGNSIVVNVLMAIFRNLFIENCKENKLF